MRVWRWPCCGRQGAAVAVVVLMMGAGVLHAQQPAVMAPLAAKSLLLDGTVTGDALVAVGERGHVLVSRDGGESWQQAPVPTRSMLTAVSFADPETGCAVGHDEAIVCTWDGGRSWDLVHWAPENESPLLTILFLDGGRALTAGAYGRFLESLDAGRTWEERWVGDEDLHLNHLVRSETGRLYLAAESGIIFRSDDSGESWEELPSPYEGSFFGTLPLEGDTLLAFGLRGNLFRSEDGGESWEDIETGTRSLLGHGSVLADGTVVVAGLAGAVLVSRDGGRSFQRFQLPDRRGISAVLESPGGRLVRVGEGGVLPLDLAGMGADQGIVGEAGGEGGES